MRIMALDFETYFDSDFTFRKLTTEEYVRDERFEVLCLGVTELIGDETQSQWIPGYDVKNWLEQQDWKEIAVIAQHAQFDGLVLSEIYSIKPGYWIDTLSMARALLGLLEPLSLGYLANKFGLGHKDVPYDKFKGRRLINIEPELLQEIGEGCVEDTRLTLDLFKILKKDFPAEEYKVVDLTVRMHTEPALLGDIEALRKIQIEEWTRKNEKLMELGVSKADLASKHKFTALLEAEHVEVETKKGKNGPIFALAKTDGFMQKLLEHDNDRIRSLAEARLDVASTINETRSAKLAQIASRGSLPIYLKYCGAHTTRWSGAESVNFQNFPRGGEIRKALYAPDGYMLAICDLSQIECRILNYVAEQWDILEAFSTGRDLYCEGATRFYGRTITKKDNPLERHLGKTLELGCGYGMGANKLQLSCRRGNPKIELTDIEAVSAIQSYREFHKQVCRYWREADLMLNNIAYLTEGEQVSWGPLIVKKGCIILPNGLPLLFSLEFTSEVNADSKKREGWKRITKRGKEAIWGGGLVENVVQAMARVVMSQAMIRIRDLGYKIITTTHDEVVALVPEENAQSHFNKIRDEFMVSPSWIPGIPLDAEGCVSKFYDK